MRGREVHALALSQAAQELECGGTGAPEAAAEPQPHAASRLYVAGRVRVDPNL